MITIKDKGRCCGCEACAQKCSKQCITMTKDNEGFSYPVVNQYLCIKCNICEKVCMFMNDRSIEYHHKNIFAAINPDEKVRRESSSGGMFTLLAEQIIKENGVVFGARFDKQWNVVHDCTDSVNKLYMFRGSKYTQSTIGTSFVKAEKYLKEGRKVLFTGTPCQILGLKMFLSKVYDNLFCVSILCHGVPSPKVWQKYISSIGNEITSINLRSKETGWGKYSIDICYTQGNKILNYKRDFMNDAFMAGFLSNMILRPSCYTCGIKLGKSKADIIIGDFWNIQNVKPEMDDDKGTSIAIAYTQKGVELLSSTKAELVECNSEESFKCNDGFKTHINIHPNREKFFSSIDKCEIQTLINNYAYNNMPIYYRIKRKLKSIISK